MITQSAILYCLLLLPNTWPANGLTPQNRIPPNSVPIASPVRRIGLAEIYYFPDADKTSVDVMNLTIWGKGENRINLGLSYSTKGPRPHLPELIQIDIGSVAGSARFKGSSKVEFIVDGRKWSPISVEAQIENEPHSVLEDYVFLLSVEQFRQIGKAKSVGIKIGPIEIQLTAAHRQAFLDMLRAAE